MKSLVKDKISLGQRMLIEEELNKRLDRYTRKFNITTNTICAYVLNEVFGFGKERIQRYLDACDAYQRHMHDKYGEDELFAMQFKLKEKGIDIVAMINAIMDDEDHGKTEIVV